MPETAITVIEFARRVGCSDYHIYKLIHAGKIRFYKVGVHFRVPLSEVEKFMRLTREGGKNGQSSKPAGKKAA